MASRAEPPHVVTTKKFCELIAEFSGRIQRIKSELNDMLDSGFGTPVSSVFLRALYGRIEFEAESFSHSMVVYSSLIRQASQWLEHGKVPLGALRIELETRLADFEVNVQEMERFLRSMRKWYL